MTQGERAVWSRVMHDYQHARAIVVKVWPKDTPPEVLQSATATVLIHFKELTQPRRRRGSQ
jgi:hypothetical protein